MTGNLVPEPRVNVRGHVVVKHVRAGSDSHERTAKRIPAPRHPEIPKAPLLAKSLRRITDGRVMLSNFSPEAVSRVESLLERVKTERPTDRWRVESNLVLVAQCSDKKEASTIFNNLAAFGDAIFRDTYSNLGRYVNGLQSYPEMAGMKDFLTNGTPAKREHALALVRFVSAFGGGRASSRGVVEIGRDGEEITSFVRVTDVELRRLVMDYPDRADDIAEIIKSDGITDAQHLREIIKHDQKPLRGGVL